MKKFGLDKKDKLCSTAAIDMLFSRGGTAYESGTEPQSVMAYPLRAVWRHNPGRHSDSQLTFLISIPKKRLHTAVERVLMRRRVREAFRLNRHNYPLQADARIDLAFIYIADKTKDYSDVQKSVCRILRDISTKSAAARETVVE